MKVLLSERKSSVWLQSIDTCCPVFLENFNRLYTVQIEIDRTAPRGEIIHRAFMAFDDDFMVNVRAPADPIICCPFCAATIEFKWDRTIPLSE